MMYENLKLWVQIFFFLPFIVYFSMCSEALLKCSSIVCFSLPFQVWNNQNERKNVDIYRPIKNLTLLAQDDSITFPERNKIKQCFG